MGACCLKQPERQELGSFDFFLINNASPRNVFIRRAGGMSHISESWLSETSLEPLCLSPSESLPNLPRDEEKLETFRMGVLLSLQLLYSVPHKLVTRTCPGDNGMQMQMTWSCNNINIMKQCKPVGPPVEK